MNQSSGLILDLFNTMNSQNIICAYHGIFTYDIVNKLLINVKSDLSLPEIEKRAAKKVYKVLVECLENIHKHASVIENVNTGVKNEGIFILSKQPNSYYIKVGNLVKNEEVIDLSNNFDRVNKLNKEQLKELYREKIKLAEISKKGGAGLGIIDMALKSESKLNYDFKTYNKELKFLTLDIEIKF